MYRTRGRVEASHDSTTGSTSVEGTGGTGGPGRGAGGWRQDHRQTNFACNSMRRTFNKPRKRCNSNDANSIFEQAAGELHAKLLCGRGLAAVPVGGGRAWLQCRSVAQGLATASVTGRGDPRVTARPPPDKFRMQFDEKNFQQTQKTLQFQRCKFNI